MSDPGDSTAARKAYEAYREVIGDPQNVAGESYRWEDMPKRVQEAFRAAAQAGGDAQRKHEVAEVLGRAEAFLGRGGGWGQADRIAQAWVRTLVQLGVAMGDEPETQDPWRNGPDGLEEGERQAMRLTVAAMLAGGGIHYGRECPASTKGKSMSEELARTAFEAYRAEVVTAFNGDPIPAWKHLDNGAAARRGWVAAAEAVARAVTTPGGTWKNPETRWEQLAPGVYTAQLGTLEPQTAGGTGEPHDGEPVQVDAGPDEDERGR